MSRKLTQKEAEKKSLDVGIKMVGQYEKQSIKTEFECPICKSIFICVPESVWIKHTKSCGHCNDPKINDKFNKLTIIKVYPAKAKGCHIKCVCECGKFWTGIASHITSECVKSCGHCSDPNVGDKFNCLIVEKIIPSPTNGCSVVAKCKCGKIWSGRASRLLSNKVQSCGHCDDPNIGDKFGQLTVTNIQPSRGGGCTVICECECGKYWQGHFNQIKDNHTTSCGNCLTFRNGTQTSKKALELEKVIQNIGYITEHNYLIWKQSRKYIKCDIIILKYKIAIEYDEWFWHGHQQKEDKSRLRKIHRLGWKTLQIKARDNLPTQQQLNKMLNDLNNGAKSRTIILSGWGQGKTRLPIENNE